MGVDNLGVVRHVGRLSEDVLVPLLLSLSVMLVDRMPRLRGLDTVRITKVTGHAVQEMVLDGRVRELDRLGNNAADGC